MKKITSKNLEGIETMDDFAKMVRNLKPTHITQEEFQELDLNHQEIFIHWWRKKKIQVFKEELQGLTPKGSDLSIHVLQDFLMELYEDFFLISLPADINERREKLWRLTKELLIQSSRIDGEE